MKRLLVCISLLALLPACAFAELKPGDKAPDFTAQASLGGKVFNFVLADALKQGPVVLYFYPAAFTSGCTIEAHNFAEAVDKFKEQHATVIGISTDNIDTLNKFSVSECRSKFAVAADPDARVAKSYDSVLMWKSGWSSRSSYVIAPDGKIIYAYTAMSPDKHVENTLDAVRNWASTHKQ
jgi:peroxiredoxin (alkyl hydroperoxide reductase subunit C)